MGQAPDLALHHLVWRDWSQVERGMYFVTRGGLGQAQGFTLFGTNVSVVFLGRGNTEPIMA